MALGSRNEGGGKKVASVPVRRTSQNSRETAKNHSDAEIFAANMNPGKTAEKVHNQGTFHDANREKENKKEHSTQYIKRISSVSASHSENSRSNARNVFPAPGITREFRVVRDNRIKESLETDQCPTASRNGQTKSNLTEKRHTKGEYHSSGQEALPDPNHDDAENTRLVDTSNQGETQASVSKNPLHSQDGHAQTSGMNVASHASSSMGLYSSSSDPVHVPSLDSRLGGTVGVIRRETGAVGVRQSFSGEPTSASQHSLLESSVPVKKFITTNIESAGHEGDVHKSYPSTDPSALIPRNLGIDSRKYSLSKQYTKKQVSYQSQHTGGHRKVGQLNMKWKAKVSQQSSTDISEVTCGNSSPLCSPENVPALCSTEKQTNELESVIIPQHLLIPENERGHIRFGSFGAVDSIASIKDNSIKDMVEKCSATPNLVKSCESTSVGVQVYSTDCSMQTSRLDPKEQATTSEQSAPEFPKSGACSMADYSTIKSDLDNNHNPSYSSESQQMDNSPKLPKLSEAFESQQNFDASFYKTATRDTVGQPVMTSQADVLSSHFGIGSGPNTVAAQQQAFTQQQHVAQLYPQPQLPHFTNCMPFRHMVSPHYIPPMGIPNYSSGTAYPHHPNGNSYLLMSGGNPQLAAMKYAQPPYKSVAAGNPTGYGNFTNAPGYNISDPGIIGASVDDITRMKYKDNNLYVPNAQVETTDLWMQNQRDSAQYYNLAAQMPHAYLSSHNASFNDMAQLPSIQYPGVYHPQANGIPNPHHLLHQQVSRPMGSNLGVSFMAPTAQVGTYQQPQLGALNWTNV